MNIDLHKPKFPKYQKTLNSYRLTSLSKTGMFTGTIYII